MATLRGGGDRGGGMRSNGMGVSRVGVGSVRRLPIQGYGRDEHTHHDRLVGGPMAGDVGGFMDIRPGESKTLYRMRLARASKNTVKALHALVVLGGNLADQLHLIVPSLLFLLERDGIQVMLQTLEQLLRADKVVPMPLDQHADDGHAGGQTSEPLMLPHLGPGSAPRNRVIKRTHTFT